MKKTSTLLIALILCFCLQGFGQCKSQKCKDKDKDGVCDSEEQCPNNPTKLYPGVCGCGFSDIDTDGDGAADCKDTCPNDPAKIAPEVCGCNVLDTDTDLDGFPDCEDDCLDDPFKKTPGICGCNVLDTDTDGDGLADCEDLCINDPTNDPDNDGVCSLEDVCPGAPDHQDADLDGVPDGCDQCPGYDDNIDTDQDGLPDGCDTEFILYSIDSLDGVFSDLGNLYDEDDALRLDSVMHCEKTDVSESKCFLTFDISGIDWERVRSSILYLRTIITHGCAGCQGPMVVKRIDVPKEVYAKMQNCLCSFDWQYPSGCGFSKPHKPFTFTSFLYEYPPGERHYSRRVNFDPYYSKYDLFDLSTIMKQGPDRHYISFELFYPNKHLSYAEDGGNHGGSGTIPYLEITY